MKIGDTSSVGVIYILLASSGLIVYKLFAPIKTNAAG
jgi:hypothetical protein